MRCGAAVPTPLARLTLEALARVLGPVASYIPGDPDEWRQLRARAAVLLPGPGPAAHTAAQRAAEERLTSQDPALPAVALYFGIGDTGPLALDPSEPALIRLPRTAEEGEPFEQVIRRRVGGKPSDLRELTAYLQGYAALMDELQRAPCADEVMERYRLTPAQLREDERLFARVFPEEPSPERLLRLLDRGLPASRSPIRLMLVRVVDLAPTRRERVLPAAGQRWRRPDGSLLTIIDADGEQLTVGLHSEGTVALQVLDRRALLEWELVMPTDVWSVAFDVDVNPYELVEPLHRHGVICDRLARPSDPRRGQAHLRAGTIEAHVPAPDETSARRVVVDALQGRVALNPDDVRVRRLPSHAIVD
jgi:hypothetical protein